MRVKQALNNVVRDLKGEKFKIVVNTDRRSYCFNIIAYNEEYSEKVLIVKYFKNIDSCDDSVASELIKLAYSINGVPVVIGESAKNERLIDYVIYRRSGIIALSPKTFNALISNEREIPHVYAYRGGLYVKINGEKLRKAREKAGFSRGELAEKVGVSRKTIYSYENDEMDATLDVAIKLEEVLNEPLVEVFHLTECFKVPSAKIDMGTQVSDPLLNKLMLIMKSLGFKFVRLKRMPFEVAGRNDRNRTKLLIKSYKRRNRDMRDLRISLKIAEVLGSNIIVLAENQRVKRELEFEKSLVITPNELRDMEKNPDSFMDEIAR